MTADEIQGVLGWCTVINGGFLLVWFLSFWLAHDRLFGVHSRMFKLSVETFDAVHYGGMAIFKFGILLLNVVPYLAMMIVRQ